MWEDIDNMYSGDLESVGLPSSFATVELKLTLTGALGARPAL